MATASPPDDATVSGIALDRIDIQKVLNDVPLPSRGGEDSDACQSKSHCSDRHERRRNMRLVVRSEQSRFTCGETQFIGPCLPASPDVPIHGKRPEREVLTVPVIAKVEDTRKTGARMADFFPRSIFPLMTQQIIDSSDDADGIGHPG